MLKSNVYSSFCEKMAENMEEENPGFVCEESDDDKDMKDGSDDSDSDDTTAQDEARIRELEKEISKNPFLYQSHVELIQKLQGLGELDRLRRARHAMHACFPLSQEIWSQWLQDEVPLAQEKEERDRVQALFELAIKDYVSVSVWLEYVQFAIGGMGEEGGVGRVREVFERAVTAVGLHVPMGATVWEAYREFENALLSGLMPKPGAVSTKEQEEAFNTQHRKVAALFRRQLAVPLQDMEETFGEYREWLGGSMEGEVDKAYQRALQRLHKVQPYEQELLESEAPHLEAYLKYLDFEVSEGDPARIQCLFERAVLDNCLVPDLWVRYTKYLDEKLKIGSISLAAYERALRNCPWSGTLWRNYILALERSAQPFEVVKGVMDKALMAGFTDSSDYLQVWTVYVDYLRRRIDWDKDHKEELETFRLTVERAADHLYENFGVEGDPEASLRQHWARIEARHCGNVQRARDLWNQVMQEGYGSQAAMWLSYYRLERTFGDVKHCRRILQRAVNSVTDWLECVTQAYIDFEREEGTLEDYEVAYAKCEAQLARVNERKAKAAEKEAAAKEQKKKQRTVAKEQKKGENAAGTDKGDQSKARAGAQQTTGKWSAGLTGARTDQEASRKRKDFQRDRMPKLTDKEYARLLDILTGPQSRISRSKEDQRLYYTLAEDSRDREGFKKPRAPDDAQDGPPAKRAKEGEATEHGEMIHHDPSKDSVTVFVSNLDYSTAEDSVSQALQQCGEITEVRLVKNYKGLSKGFGYVQFSDPNGVLSALKMDRHNVDGRPMFVSRCEDRSSGRKTHQFRYATAMEKNKLFVKNLPFTCTAEALENIFKEHGKVKDVRLVTYRSGAPKGLAYVEFETEEMAAHALLKTDGLQVGEHVISVAISNPPQRKQPTALAPLVPSLGGGKKETEFHGKARTQVALVPRAVQRPGSGAPSQKASATSSNQSASTSASEQSNSGPKAKMSNDDFRKLLLK